MTYSDSDAPQRGFEAEPVLATYRNGAVVQLVSADVAANDALVVPIDDATIIVTDRRIFAMTSTAEWSWLVHDIVRATHGRQEPWTILAVPGVSDHGVAVTPADAEAFRQSIARLLTPLGVVAAIGGSDQEPPPVMPAPVIDLEARRSSNPAPAVEVEPPAPVAPEPVVPVLEDLEPPAAGEVDHPFVFSWSSTEAPPTPAITEPVSTIDLRTPGGLEARSISAWFGTHHVLDRVSLTMSPGQVTALIGPSGCGKSTFLRILNRMHEMIPSASLAGEVLLDGADIYDAQRRLTDARRQIGMVFQKPNPFPAMSIYDNVIASFRLTGTKVGKAEKDHVVESCLTKAGLWNEVRDRLRQPGGGLSGGQQQRLCIARALAIKPKVLLMDEPCSALDPTSTRRIERTIIELADEVTIVIVTHNMQQAVRVSSQCAFFLAEQGTPGVIVEYGSTEAMFSQPQDPRTSDYVNGRFG